MDDRCDALRVSHPTGTALDSRISGNDARALVGCNTRRALHRSFSSALIAALTACSFAALADTPKPTILITNPSSRCIAPRDEMRRTHMDLLKHQRDKTVREGVRGAKVSLNGCIECHANSKNGSVLGSNQNFCQSCHSYAAVQLDCFECHQAKPEKKPLAQATR